MLHHIFCVVRLLDCLRIILISIFVGAHQVNGLSAQNVESYDAPHIRLGTFIIATSDHAKMDAIRKNVLTHNSNYGKDHDCVVKNTFYVGNRGDFKGQDDVLRGSFVENMNSGKSIEWIVDALATYPKADYIIKRDLDTAVNLTRLCDMVVKKYDPQVVDVYFGRMNDYRWCGLHKHCAPLGCTDFQGKAPATIPRLATKDNPREGADMISNKDQGANCWVYMSGGFYGISRHLAKKMASHPHIHGFHQGFEDIQIGKLVAAVGHTGNGPAPTPVLPPVDTGCKCKDDKTPSMKPTMAPSQPALDGVVKVLNFENGVIWCHYENQSNLLNEVLSGDSPYLMEECIKR
jgi:hypothetical protein